MIKYSIEISNGYSVIRHANMLLPCTVDAAEYTDTNLANGTYGYKVVVTGGDNAGVSNVATATVTGTAAANKTASAPKE